MLRNKEILTEWQNADKTLKEAIRVLKEKHDAIPPKVATLINIQKAFLYNGILKKKVTINAEIYEVIILPDLKPVQKCIVDCLHLTLGHSSKSAFLNEAKRIIACKGIEAYFDKKVQLNL